MPVSCSLYTMRKSDYVNTVQPAFTNPINIL